MHLVPRCDLLDRLVAAKRLKRNLGLEISRKPSSCRHLRIPPLTGGIHLNLLSDFLGPPHRALWYKQLSVGWAMALGCTVVSTVIRSKLFSFTAPASTATPTVTDSTLLRTLWTEAFAPVGHGAGIDGKAVLKELKAAEILPVGIIDPALDSFFVRQVIHVLQIMQPDYQPRRLGGTAQRFVMLAESFIKIRPGRHSRQSDQGVAHIDDRVQALAKQIGVTAIVLLGLHKNLPEKDGTKVDLWYFPIFRAPTESLLPR